MSEMNLNYFWCLAKGAKEAKVQTKISPSFPSIPSRDTRLPC